jgi:hypothetical protein
MKLQDKMSCFVNAVYGQGVAEDKRGRVWLQ